MFGRPWRARACKMKAAFSCRRARRMRHCRGIPPVYGHKLKNLRQLPQIFEFTQMPSAFPSQEKQSQRAGTRVRADDRAHIRHQLHLHAVL